MSATTTVTRHYESDGKEVFPCRCGETHRGDYGAYDYAHHNCFHDEDLLILDTDYVMCPLCGETWHLVKK